MIEFKSERLRREWHGGKADERLLNVLRILADKFGGLRITCLLRTVEENSVLPGAAAHSGHIPDALSGQCSAADFNPPESVSDLEQRMAWRENVGGYVQKHFRGIRCIPRDHGTAPHVHLELTGEVILLVQKK